MEKEDITVFTKAVKKQFDAMSKKQLYRVNIDKQSLWELYLKSFPEGTNPVYKERTEHDCNCCKNFIRDVGNVVAIENGKIVTIWDIEIPTFYNDIAKELSAYVKQGKIVDLFTHRERQHQTKTWKPNDSYCVDGIKYYAHGHAVFPAYDKTTKEVVACEEK